MWQNCFVCFGIFRVALEKAFNEINWDLLGLRDFAVSPDFPISQSSSSSLAVGEHVAATEKILLIRKLNKLLFVLSHSKSTLNFSSCFSLDERQCRFFFSSYYRCLHPLLWRGSTQDNIEHHLIQLYFLSFFPLLLSAPLQPSFILFSRYFPSFSLVCHEKSVQRSETLVRSRSFRVGSPC